MSTPKTHFILTEPTEFKNYNSIKELLGKEFEYISDTGDEETYAIYEYKGTVRVDQPKISFLPVKKSN